MSRLKRLNGSAPNGPSLYTWNKTRDTGPSWNGRKRSQPGCGATGTPPDPRSGRFLVGVLCAPVQFFLHAFRELGDREGLGQERHAHILVELLGNVPLGIA